MGDALRAYEEELRRVRPQIGRPLRPKKKRLSAPIGASLERPQAPIRIQAPRSYTKAPLKEETEEEEFEKRLGQERELGELRSDLAAEDRARRLDEPQKPLTELQQAQLEATKQHTARSKALTEQGAKRLGAAEAKVAAKRQKALDEAEDKYESILEYLSERNPDADWQDLQRQAGMYADDEGIKGAADVRKILDAKAKAKLEKIYLARREAREERRLEMAEEAAKKEKVTKPKEFKTKKPVTSGAKQTLNRYQNASPQDQQKLIELAQEALKRDPDDQDAKDFLREANVRAPEQPGYATRAWRATLGKVF